MKTITEITTKQPAAAILRLAPYCRVSSDSEDQRHSFAAQVKYYTEYTAAHPEYELVDIYADEGITGTEMKKRDDFNRLLRDCRKRKIDRVITKTVSRFARNTAELLTVVRALKELGVSVYFEEQGIDTETLDLEMILTFPGMAAQKESETISENMRWSYRKRMETGEFNCCRAAYGYSLIDGELQINEAEAKVVRRIFHLYLQGCGKQAIANQLNTEGVPKRYGQKTWYLSAIDYVLNNERYMGDSLLQKSYTTETLPFRKMKNDGRLPQYYVENNHPAIIDAATFARVQEELARRASKRKVKQVGTKTEQGKYSSKYALTELLVCGECGTPYRRCTWTSLGRKYPVWRCTSRLNYGTKYCHDSPTIKEEPLQAAILTAINSVMSNKPALLNLIKNAVSVELLSVQGQTMSLADIERRLAQLDEQFQQLLAEAIDAEDKEACNTQFAEILAEQTTLKKQKEAILQSSMDADRVCTRMKQAEETIENAAPTITEWNENAVRQIVERVTVLSADEILVQIKGGAEIKQRLEG